MIKTINDLKTNKVIDLIDDTLAYIGTYDECLTFIEDKYAFEIQSLTGKECRNYAPNKEIVQILENGVIKTENLKK